MKKMPTIKVVTIIQNCPVLGVRYGVVELPVKLSKVERNKQALLLNKHKLKQR